MHPRVLARTAAACGLLLLASLPLAAQAPSPERVLARSPVGALLPLPLPRAWGEAGPATLLHAQLAGLGGGLGGDVAVAVGIDRVLPAVPDTVVDEDGEEREASTLPVSLGAVAGYVPATGSWMAGLRVGSMGVVGPRGGPAEARAGGELVLGFADVARDVTTSLGVRFPVEVAAAGRRRAALFFVPTVTWATFDFRRCTDDGPGDDCGTAGVQLHSARPRWLLAGGVGVEVVPGRARLEAGVQRLMSRGEEPRAGVALAWRP